MGCGSAKDVNANTPKRLNATTANISSANTNTANPLNSSGIEVIFVLGGPGSGKGTQCAKMREEYGFIHVSTGDLLRQELKKGGQYADELNSYMKEGKLVPSEMLVKLVQQEINSNGSKGRYLLDGFPRSLDNYRAWQLIIQDKVNVKFLLYVECSFEVMEKRLIKRGETSGRSDDNAETIKKRFDTFTQETQPILDQFRKENKVSKVNSDNSVEDVYTQIKTVLNQQNIMAYEKPQVIFVLGGPGSGKGTQCQRLKEQFGFTHLSAGDLLREEQKLGGQNSQLIDMYIKEGKLVPSELIVKLIRKEFLKNDMKGKYLLDGFPRNEENLKGWNDELKHMVDLKFLLYFDCSEEEMQKRLLIRGKTSGRADDNGQTIKKRFDTFNNETKPVIQFFISQEKCKTINAEQPVNKIYSQVKKSMKDMQFSKNSDVKKTDKQKSVIFVLGGPGSGKGTQCAKLIEQQKNVTHLSTGDLLREELKTSSVEAKDIQQYMNEGKLVPSELLVKLVQKRIQSNEVEQIIPPRWLSKVTRKYRCVELGCWIFDQIESHPILLGTPECYGGKTTKPSKDIWFYIIQLIIPCHLGRSDDNPETIKKRLDTYVNETMPVVEYYKKFDMVITIDATQEVNKVFESTWDQLKKEKIIKH